MLVAVAEDDPDISFLLHALLTDKGYEVAMTDNGRDALALCRERRPDGSVDQAGCRAAVLSSTAPCRDCLLYTSPSPRD